MRGRGIGVKTLDLGGLVNNKIPSVEHQFLELVHEVKDKYTSPNRSPDPLKSPGQVCVNLIDPSWHSLTQYATSISISLMKVKVSK